MHLIVAYLDVINANMCEIGGDELRSYYWASSERGDTGAWGVYCSPKNAGFVYGNYKYDCNAVRPVADFKK